MQRLQFSISWLQTTAVSFPSVLETEMKLTSVLEECLTGDIPVELVAERKKKECNGDRKFGFSRRYHRIRSNKQRY